MAGACECGNEGTRINGEFLDKLRTGSVLKKDLSIELVGWLVRQSAIHSLDT